MTYKLMTLLLGLALTSCGMWETATGSKDSKGSDGNGQKKSTSFSATNPGFFLSIDTYEDCQAIQDTVFEQQKIKLANDWERTKYYFQNPRPSVDYMEDAAPQMANAGSSTSDNQDETFTNTQEEGIDEADTVKIGNDQIFVVGETSAVVTDRASLEYIGRVQFDDLKNVVAYTPHGQLVLVGSTMTPSTPAQNNQFAGSTIYNPNYSQHQGTLVRVYEVSAGSMPELAKEYEFKGNYVDSRYTNGNLVLVMRNQFSYREDAFTETEVEVKREDKPTSENPWNPSSENATLNKIGIEKNPIKIEDQKVNGIPCTSIVKQPIMDMDFNITEIASIDVKKLGEPKSKATLGGGDQIYMSHRSLYITKSGVAWKPWVPEEVNSTDHYNYYRSLDEGLVITKADIAPNTGEVGIVATGMVMGKPKDQYAFKEYTDKAALAIATTTWAPLPDGKTDQKQMLAYANGVAPWEIAQQETRGRNHLWVLIQDKHSLKLAKAEKNFGEPGEDIRSARFMNDHAYIVTFKKTDPLYTFDMSEPKDFAMVGKLKIPGFSMYLHPAEDHLIGIGFDADDQGGFAWFQGIQVSLFDISDPTNVSRTDNVVHGQRGSNSEVTGDPHAFFYSAEENLFALPLVELGGNEQTGGSGYGHTLEFSGAVFYSIEGDDLVEQGRASHFDLIPESCRNLLQQGSWWQNTVRSQDINRIYEVDGSILTISQYGIKQYDLNDLSQPTQTSVFAGIEECTNQPVWY